MKIFLAFALSVFPYSAHATTVPPQTMAPSTPLMLPDNELVSIKFGEAYGTSNVGSGSLSGALQMQQTSALYIMQSKHFFPSLQNLEKTPFDAMPGQANARPFRWKPDPRNERALAVIPSQAKPPIQVPIGSTGPLLLLSIILLGCLRKRNYTRHPIYYSRQLR